MITGFGNSQLLLTLQLIFNFLNLKLQGEKSFVHDLFHNVKVFRTNFALYENQLGKSMFDHFEACKKFASETSVDFP